MVIKQFTGLFSQYDVISRFLCFMNLRVDFMTIQSYAYEALTWPFPIE